MADRVADVDFQKQRVYDFENEIVEPICHILLSRADIKALVERSCGLTDTPVPDLRFTGSTDLPCRAVVGGGIYRMDIADWGRTPPVVLHECAHLAQHADPAGRQELRSGLHHGPIFVRLAIDLYAAFMTVAVDDLERKAAAHRIVFAPRRMALGNFTNLDF